MLNRLGAPERMCATTSVLVALGAGGAAGASAGARRSRRAKPACATTAMASESAISTAGTSNEDLGRATWTLLHTLASQLPERPSKQQRKDLHTLVDVLTRVYPCGECAYHFRQFVKADPPRVDSRSAFAQWLCRLHNNVNRRLGKAEFNCTTVDAKWGGLQCTEHDDACDMLGSPPAR